MNGARRRRAEAALAEHFRALLAKGYVSQDFDETMRGGNLTADELPKDPRRGATWVGLWCVPPRRARPPPPGARACPRRCAS